MTTSLCILSELATVILAEICQPLRSLQLLRPCPSLVAFRAGAGTLPAPAPEYGPAQRGPARAVTSQSIGGTVATPGGT